MLYNYTPNIQIDLTQARTAILGEISVSEKRPSTRVHTTNPCLYFPVPAELQGRGKGLIPIFKSSLVESFPGFNVLLAAWHLGNISLISAFHMQDPRTRDLLEPSLKSGLLTSAIAFYGTGPYDPDRKTQVLWYQDEIDLRNAAQNGKSTDGVLTQNEWDSMASIMMIKNLKTLGVDEALHKGGTVYIYNVAPQDGRMDLRMLYGENESAKTPI